MFVVKQQTYSADNEKIVNLIKKKRELKNGLDLKFYKYGSKFHSIPSFSVSFSSHQLNQITQ